MKSLGFVGSSLVDLRAFPTAARSALGVELMRVQFSGVPANFKPLKEAGSGDYEIRVHLDGAWRAIYVLHAFQKKARRTAQRDIELAAKRCKLIGGLK